MASAEVWLLALPVAALARRRHLVLALAASVIGPPRDYLVAALFPDWIAHSPGIAPVLAIATIYALLVVVGHAVMRIVVSPAQADSFAPRISGEGKNSAAGNLP